MINLKPIGLAVGIVSMLAACTGLFGHHADASTVSVYSLPTLIQTTNIATTTSATSLTVTFPVKPVVGDAVICTQGAAAQSTITTPTLMSPWTQLGSTKTANNTVSGAVYFHTVVSGDGNPSLQFSVVTPTTWFVVCEEWHKPAATPVSSSLFASAIGTNVNSLTFGSITPNISGAVPVEVDFQALSSISVSDPAFTATSWKTQQTALSAQELYNTVGWTPLTSALTGNPTFANFADSAGMVYFIYPLTGNFNAGGRVAVAATPTPTPTPGGGATPTPTPAVGIAAYAPTYVYEGTGGGGGGGNVCGGSPCITGSTFKLLDIRYAEGNFSGTYAVDGTNVCNQNTDCNPVWYNTLNDMDCATNGAQTSIYNGLNSIGGTDPGFIHKSSPTSSSDRVTYPKGSSVCSGQSGLGQYYNPKYTSGTNNIISLLNTYWYLASGFINSHKWIISRWDNTALYGTTVEFGSGSYANVQSYMSATYALFANFTGFPQGFNAGGTGGGNFNNGSYSGTALQFACSGHVCNDPDDLCANNSGGTFKFVMWERPLVSGNYPSSIYLQQNISYMINSAFEYYNTTNCANVDMVDLEPSSSGATDNMYFRDAYLAARMMLTPGDYDGTFGHRAWVMLRYNENLVTSQVGVYPEDGLQFIPANTAGKFVDGGGDGNGCHSGDSGGAAAFAVACTGTDHNGFVGAIYGRPGECYKWGTDIGKCFVLINQTNQAVTIQNGWCQVSTPSGTFPACNTYGFFWHYQGSGPENCYEDIGFGSNCAGGTQICPNANGCNGAWGESATTGSIPGMTPSIFSAGGLGSCPGPLDNGGTSSSPTVLSHDCTVVLLSQ